jgi:hypothetical protein
MTDRIERSRAESERFLRWAAVAFAIAVAVHGLDHVRRGMTASPTDVMIAGAVQFVFVAIVVTMTLMGRQRSPEAAIVVGFVSALLFIYAHVLPTWWRVLSDSFVSPPHTNVSWFSWVTAVGEIGTGTIFGVAGVHARLTRDRNLLSVSQ